MKILHYMKQFISDPKIRVRYLSKMGFYNMMQDEEYLKKVFKAEMGYDLNLENPKTFSEKIQWLKLYDRNPEYTAMVDKYQAKRYVADIIGEQYIIPTIGVWDHAEDIDFKSLPDKFVLKCNHNSGLGMCICKDKTKLNINKVLWGLKKGLAQNYYLTGREWPYKNVKPLIIAEQYMKDDASDELKDYKFFCFGGIPKYCQVISDRSTEERIDFFDMEWNHQPFVGLTLNIKNSDQPVSRPVTFETMKELAKTLAPKIPFCRVDFYEVNEQPYFGEITFYPASGFGFFTPDNYNTILGDMIKLPLDKKTNQ